MLLSILEPCASVFSFSSQTSGLFIRLSLASPVSFLLPLPQVKERWMNFTTNISSACKDPLILAQLFRVGGNPGVSQPSLSNKLATETNWGPTSLFFNFRLLEVSLRLITIFIYNDQLHHLWIYLSSESKRLSPGQCIWVLTLSGHRWTEQNLVVFPIGWEIWCYKDWHNEQKVALCVTVLCFCFLR